MWTRSRPSIITGIIGVVLRGQDGVDLPDSVIDRIARMWAGHYYSS